MAQVRFVAIALSLWCAWCHAEIDGVLGIPEEQSNTGSVFRLIPQGVYKKSCEHKDWIGLRTNAWRMMQENPGATANRLYQIARALCGERPQVSCNETLMWYMVHYLGNLDLYKLSDKRQKKVRYFTSHLISDDNKRLLSEYPATVQQFVYLRIARGAAACNATEDLVSAINMLLETPCTEVQRRYWKKARYNTQRGVLSTSFKIGSDNELRQHMELWSDVADSQLYRAQRSDRATKEIAQRKFVERYSNDPAKAAQLSTDIDLHNIAVTTANIDSIFIFLRSNATNPTVCKRLVYQMIRLGKYEYAVDLLDWYGDTLKPLNAEEAELQVRAYFKCYALKQAVQLLEEWGSQIPGVRREVLCYMKNWGALSEDTECAQRIAWDMGHWSKIDNSDMRRYQLAQHWTREVGNDLESAFATSLKLLQVVRDMYPVLKR
jgi:hypothetical protein